MRATIYLSVCVAVAMLVSGCVGSPTGPSDAILFQWSLPAEGCRPGPRAPSVSGHPIDAFGVRADGTVVRPALPDEGHFVYVARWATVGTDGRPNGGYIYAVFQWANPVYALCGWTAWP